MRKEIRGGETVGKLRKRENTNRGKNEKEDQTTECEDDVVIEDDGEDERERKVGCCWERENNIMERKKEKRR